MATATSLSALESALNRILAGDPDTPARLRRIAGRTLRVDAWLMRDVSIFVTFDADGVHLRESFDGEPDAAIAGGPLGFARAAGDPGSRDVFTDGSLTVSGDALLVQSVAELFRRYRYDWQARVQPLIGEAATWRLESTLSQLDAWSAEVRRKLTADAGEFLREERELLASREAVTHFTDAVDALASDVARLEKRVERLEKRRG